MFQEKDLKYNIIEDYAFVDNDDEEEDYSDILDQELIMEFNKEKEEEKKEKFKKIKKQMEENKKLLEDLENN